jgi:hypothetical protein
VEYKWDPEVWYWCGSPIVAGPEEKSTITEIWA